MSKKIRDTKLRTLIKAYLVCNKGKKYTAKEISEWINNNNFCLNRALCNGMVIGRLISNGMYQPNHILYDVECEVGKGNRKLYWVN